MLYNLHHTIFRDRQNLPVHKQNVHLYPLSVNVHGQIVDIRLGTFTTSHVIIISNGDSIQFL